MLFTYYLGFKLRVVQFEGHVLCVEDTRNAHKDSFGKYEEKLPLDKPKRGLQFNIKLDLKKWEKVM